MQHTFVEAFAFVMFPHSFIQVSPLMVTRLYLLFLKKYWVNVTLLWFIYSLGDTDSVKNDKMTDKCMIRFESLNQSRCLF